MDVHGARVSFCGRAFLFLALILMLLAAFPAVAEEGHSHVGWTAWTDSSALPATSGKYYLDTDVTLDGNMVYTPRFTAKEKEAAKPAESKPVPKTGDSEDPMLLTLLLLLCVGIPAMTLMVKFSTGRKR